jgi:hypothetical protein
MEAQRLVHPSQALRTSPSSRAWYPIECVHDDGNRLLLGGMQRLKLAAETLPVSTPGHLELSYLTNNLQLLTSALFP